MLVIGELINCTRKKVGAAAQQRDVEFFKEIARKQANAGADMLDVNGGLPGQEMEVLPWLVNIVQETLATPLCLDSADPAALRGALPLCQQRAMINSVTDEPARMQALLSEESTVEGRVERSSHFLSEITNHVGIAASVFGRRGAHHDFHSPGVLQ